MHPEMLLFLSKIRKLSVREDNSHPNSSTVSEISIFSEKNFQARKNMHAESYTLHLSAEESGKGEEECGYYMWRQKFPVKQGNKVEKRTEIDEWVITLAFPHGQRLSRGKQLSPGVYAFLPTEMVTDFPFIIQADFLLASSREAILFDSPWNRGILECVPSAFINAFVTLVKSRADAPAMSLPSIFTFLPVNPSLIPLLDPVRSSIKNNVLAEDIVPCESYSPQKIFCKPSEVARLEPAFWTILDKAREHGMDLKNLSTHGTYILSSHFDKSTYDSVLEFLGIESVSTEWYAKCIEGSNLVKEAHEQLYLEIIYFVANNWQNCFSVTNMVSIPLLRYVDRNGVLSFWSVSSAIKLNDRLCIASDRKYRSWLISWNKEFPFSSRLFLHPSTQDALQGFSQKTTVENWLRNTAKVEFVSVYSYGLTVVRSLGNDPRPVIAFAHFLDHSLKMNHIDSDDLPKLCRVMPVIDSYGDVVKERNGIIVPAKGSKWVGLLGANPWRNDGYIELSADYVSEDQLLEFLKIHVHASDVPFIHPPNASFRTVSSPLTVDNAFLLLEWIRNIKSNGVALPDRFLACVKEGCWLKTSVGYKPPEESFLSSANWGSLLQSASSFVDIPMIDQKFYLDKLHMYKKELKAIGVRFEFQEASAYIGSCLMSMAASNTLTRDSVYSLLRLIRFLREMILSPSELIANVKDACWMKSTLGYRRPADCIIQDSEWTVASCISNQSFLDVHFYGKDILQYTPELELLGVIVGFKDNYELVINNFKFSSTDITSQATVLILKCIRYVHQCEDFVRKLQGLKWLKTNMGYKYPDECILFGAKHSLCMEDGPFIDEAFYGSEIASFKDALATIGVVVDVNCGGDLIARHLRSHKDMTTISRIYMYLMKNNWKPVNNTSDWIWIPNESGGEWVSSRSSVLNDKNNLFSLQLHILDKYYERKLLEFFSLTFGVRHEPSSEDYCKLWATWENSVQMLAITDCVAFWKFIATNWTKKTEELLSGCVKVPVCTNGKIILGNKENVFIPDDLLLADLFNNLPRKSLFIWYPCSTLPSMSRARLNRIYNSIGVQRISTAVIKNDSFTLDNVCFRTVDSSKVIKVGLLQIIIAYLADPALDIHVEQRHRMASCLLNVTVQETDKPITVGYSVRLSTGEVVDVKASRMLRWERESCKLYMQCIDGKSSCIEKIEFATYFAEEISQGLLFEMADHIPTLAELIKVGSLLNFQDTAVGFLLKSKNLQLFPEDVDFLKSSMLGGRINQ